ncbi:MAG: OB-fold nucleic acid binding domain-containing protein, partial [Nitrococcus sp.]|nr:OB-fold nucleic acid binding domain-containing protein [Nitrococcus sp.]
YLRRRQGLEAIDYPSPAIEGVLSRTLGVPIFQEQVMQLAVVAAGFTPGEADQLRRSMAAWRRKGGLEHFRERLLRGMAERGYAQAFAERIFAQIQGFGEYGFPESHAASFALLVYVSAWLKRFEPAVFTCALLNSQPMGFYAPAQLVRDARAHGVDVRRVDVTVSEWDCTLEPAAGDSLALRLGLRLIKGISATGGKRVVHARAVQALRDVQDLARRAQLSRGDLKVLADAGALAPLAGHRRDAWWQVLGVEQDLPVLQGAEIREPRPALKVPTEGEDLVYDYNSTGLSLGRHPLALLRPQLRRQRFRTAAELRELDHKRLARAAGLVISRQCPSAENGIVFVTLEDETGMVNVVIWKPLVERFRRIVAGARLLGVVGIWERHGEVTHLIAGRLEDHSHLLGELTTRSRDFH